MNIVSYYHRRTLSHNFLGLATFMLAVSKFSEFREFGFTTHSKDMKFTKYIFAIYHFKSNLTGIWFHTS